MIVTGQDKAVLPRSSSSQDEGDGVAGEDPGQTGEVRVAVGWLHKHTLVHLSLERRRKAEEEKGGEDYEYRSDMNVIKGV